MARLLLERSCDVSVIHSKTSEENKHRLLQNADLIVVATGHRNTLINADLTHTDIKFGEGIEAYENGIGDDWKVNPKCFIVDVGMNRNDEGKLCGDCEAVTVCEKTPVPGGVGLLTRLALITNLMKLAKLAK
jgi:methylenetetrahydrofolate dehydrogenase (NADP+)/methenyltetrahydrofolate cyclohydrolase